MTSFVQKIVALFVIALLVLIPADANVTQSKKDAAAIGHVTIDDIMYDGETTVIVHEQITIIWLHPLPKKARARAQGEI